MTQKIVLHVPAQPEATLAQLNDILGFGLDNGGNIAEWFKEDAQRWSEDHLVWLFSQSNAQFDCVHSLYSAVMAEQSTFFELLSIHGLFCLAAHLKQTESSSLQSFTGLVYAFGSSKSSKKMVLNHKQHVGVETTDLLTPVLFIENGHPRSVYTMWHSDDTDESLVGFCGSTTMFSYEEEAARLAA